MTKFLDRVRHYSHLDRRTGEAGRTGNFAHINPCTISTPIYLEMRLLPEGTLDITAYNTDLASKYPNVSGGYELYEHVVKDKWDINLEPMPIGNISVVSRVNKKLIEDMLVTPEYMNTSLRETLIKSAEDISSYLGWQELFVSSEILGQKAPKKTGAERVKTTFEHIKERLFGRAPEEPQTESYPVENYDIFRGLGYVDAIKDDQTSPDHVPMKITPRRRNTLQPDILETLTGIRLNGDLITSDDKYTPRFQFTYRIIDKNFNDLISNPSASK